MTPFNPTDLRCELLDVLDAAVVVVEVEGFIAFATDRAASILAVSREQLVGTRVDDVIAPLDELLNDDPTEERRKLRLPRNEQVVIGYRIANVEGDGAATHFAIVFQDITSWETLKDERDRLMRLAAVSEVLPSILHELKNPLAAIGTAVEILIEECSDEHIRSDLHSVLTEIRRMGLTLEGIGSVGRGLKAQSYGAVDHAMLQTAKVLSRQAEERGITIECDVPTMPLLPFDVATIRAILFNLVTNSIHACPSGSRISVSARLLDSGQRFEMAVEDTGKGMPPAVVERCRDLFFTTKQRGTGIGLALCDRAVKSAGGTLEVDSEEGRGTRIRLNVPVSKPRNRGFRQAASAVRR